MGCKVVFRQPRADDPLDHPSATLIRNGHKIAGLAWGRVKRHLSNKDKRDARRQLMRVCRVLDAR